MRGKVQIISVVAIFLYLSYSIVSDMLKYFDPSVKGRGFFKRSGKELLNLKLTKKTKGIKKLNSRAKMLEASKKKTEDSIQNKTEKLKHLKSELDALK